LFLATSLQYNSCSYRRTLNYPYQLRLLLQSNTY